MAKRIIECQVSDEYVLGAGVVVGAVGSHDDVVLRLTFGDMWEGLNIYATFWDSKGESSAVVLLNPATMLVEGTTMTYDLPVPSLAKKYEGQMALTFTGYTLVATVSEGDGTTTSNTIEESATISTTSYFRVLPSKSVVLEGLSVTPTISQQLQAAMTQHTVDVKEWMDRFEPPERGVDYWTPEDVAEIKAQIEGMFGVEVATVNTINMKRKAKRQGYTSGYTAAWKKAIVTLKPDSKTIEFFEGMN